MTRSVEFGALGLAMERKKFEPWRPREGSAKLAENEKGPVKLITWVKIAHSFLQPVPDQFYVIILSLPM